MTGSTFMARRAGIQQAASATTSSAPGTTTYVSGSRALTPNANDHISEAARTNEVGQLDIKHEHEYIFMFEHVSWSVSELRVKQSRKKRRARGRPVLLRRESLPPSPVQVRSKANRERIRDAALECFREHGYGATSIDTIASRAQVAVGGVYLHFKSKRQLLLVLMDELLESLAAIQPTIREQQHPRDAIRALLRDAFNRDLKFLGAYRAWREAVPTDPELAEFDGAIHSWTQQRVVDLFTAFQRLPGARRGVDVERLGGLMDRLFWTLLAEALWREPTELLRSIDVATDVTYHALFADGGGGTA